MARKKKEVEDGEPVIIKKYANRRLYNTQSSKYITLDFLAEMTKQDIDFKVVDAKSGDDITHSVLTQIIMEEENTGENMLPVSFLKQIISMYGGAMQQQVPGFLENAMDKFRAQSEQMEDAFEKAIPPGPLGDLAKQNIKMARAARDAFMSHSPESQGPDQAPEDNAEDNEAELEALKKQMAEIQARINSLDS